MTRLRTYLQPDDGEDGVLLPCKYDDPNEGPSYGVCSLPPSKPDMPAWTLSPDRYEATARGASAVIREVALLIPGDDWRKWREVFIWWQAGDALPVLRTRDMLTEAPWTVTQTSWDPRHGAEFKALITESYAIPFQGDEYRRLCGLVEPLFYDLYEHLAPNPLRVKQGAVDRRSWPGL